MVEGSLSSDETSNTSCGALRGNATIMGSERAPDTRLEAASLVPEASCNRRCARTVHTLLTPTTNSELGRMADGLQGLLTMNDSRLAVMVALLSLGALGAGCVEKESMDPGMIVREETTLVNREAPPSRATSRTVRCGCDRDGDLHIAAPQGSEVTRPLDATYEAEAQIVLPDEGRSLPLRQTKSLGFIGDNKLGASRSRGGPWNAPDGLLPPHQHIEPRYGSTYFGPYRPRYAPRWSPYIPSGVSTPMTPPMTPGAGAWGAGGAVPAPARPSMGPGWH